MTKREERVIDEAKEVFYKAFETPEESENVESEVVEDGEAI